MNIFALDNDPETCARMHCDKHVVKMIVEYAQLLSTAHRLLDGVTVLATDSENRVKPKQFKLLGGESVEVVSTPVGHKWAIRDAKAYNSTHANHPCAVWVRESRANYNWLKLMWLYLLTEYTVRYDKRHAAASLQDTLAWPPNDPWREMGSELTPFPQAMPPQYQVPDDPIAAYRNFYVGIKSRFARWTAPATVPDWFKAGIKDYDASRFQRTSRVRPCSPPTPDGDD